MDPSSQSELLPLLKTLLASQSPLTLGATLTAFSEICPDRLDLLHPFYRHICRALVDADEWGQVVALEVLQRYARTMLEKPDEAGETQTGQSQPNGVSSDDEFDGIDQDLAMLLDLAKPLLQSRNSAVVVSAAKMYYNLAPAHHSIIGQKVIVSPLIRLAGTAGTERNGSEEIAAMVWEVIAEMAEERPWLFTGKFQSFYLYSADSAPVMKAKLRVLVALISEETASAAMTEFKHYATLPNDTVAEEAVRAIGHCVRTLPNVADSGLRSLMRLLGSKRGAIVAQSVIVLKGVILQGVSGADPQRLVARLAKQLDNITNPSARASVFWLVGQFAASDAPDETLGLKWDGVAPWVPDVLRKGVKDFTQEEPPAKLKILTLAAKVLVLSPTAPKLPLFTQYLFNLARYDANYDVRDRARYLAVLLRGVREDAEDQDTGGVTLRREQVRVVLLGKREVPSSATAERDTTDVASMSRVVKHKLGGYQSLPDWTDDPTDSSLRDSELERPKPSPSAVPPISSVPYATPPASAIPASAIPASRLASTPGLGTPQESSPGSSIPHTTRGKFRDLDDFLNSESESEEEEEEETESEDSEPEIQRRDFVPEYEDGSESEDSSEYEEEDEPLYSR